MKTIHRTLFAVAMLAFLAASTFAQVRVNDQRTATATFTSASGTAYTAGDSVGTVQTLTGVASANYSQVTLDTILIRDSAGQNKGLKILFFDGSAPTLTDNAAFAFGSSLPNLIAVLDIDPSDYSTLDSKGVVSRSLLSLRMRLAAATSLYVAVVTTGTPTYGNGGTLSIDFHFSY